MSARSRDRTPSLRSRLTAGMVILLVVAGLVVGAVSEVSMRHFLISRIDDQLLFAGGRYAASIEHPDRHETERGGRGDADDVIPGQTEGTLGIRLRSGRIIQAIVVGHDGTTHAVRLTATDVTNVSRITPGGGAQSIDLTSLGDYRVRAARGHDGDTQISGLPLHTVNQTLIQLLIVEAALFAGLVVLGGTAAGFLVRRRLQPLDHLARTALEVSTLALTGGEQPLPTTATHQSTREVDQVSESFDRMLERVRTAMTARDATEARLRRFVADASHELRTPLATIRASAEYGADTKTPLPEQTTDALSRIRAAADRMGLLVADLLLLARLDAGRPLASTEVDLTRLVLDTVTDASTAAQDHHWELDLPEEPVTVDGDDQRLHQVLANLLANARTHTPAGTTVTTGITLDSDHVETWVRDNGPGIPEDLRGELFERFTRADTSRSRAHGSTGLGLAIAAGIARAHGGTLTHETPPSGGACFRLLLPTHPKHPGRTNTADNLDPEREAQSGCL